MYRLAQPQNYVIPETIISRDDCNTGNARADFIDKAILMDSGLSHKGVCFTSGSSLPFLRVPAYVLYCGRLVLMTGKLFYNN